MDKIGAAISGFREQEEAKRKMVREQNPEERVELIEHLREAAFALDKKLEGRKPEVGIVLGSGLGPLADRIEGAVKIPFREIPYMRTSTSTFHIGQFVCGRLGGKCVLAMQGRLHGYEGYSAQDVAFPIWLMHQIGIDTLFTSNAAGAINESYAVGDFCAMADHINFTGRNPVEGSDPNKLSFRFFSMMDCYDPGLRRIAQEVAQERDVRLHEGVYLALLGPSFETVAEIEAFKRWGADTVAMSVVEEVIAARHVGMRVFGVSLLSNMACGISGSSPEEADMHDYFSKSEEPFARLIVGMLEKL